MAFVNPNKPSGLSPVATLSGSDWTGKGRMYAIPTSDATYNYFPGDLVALSATAGGDVNGLPLITMCAAGATAVGVIAAVGTNPQGGPYIDPNNLSRTYAPVTKLQTYYALVVDDPNMIFEIQENAVAASLTTAAVQLNANIILGAAATAANPGVYVSQTLLNNNTPPGTTNTYNLKILSLAQRPDNHFVSTLAGVGSYQKWWVMINNHAYRIGVTAP
jgi:hypothetical protein